MSKELVVKGKEKELLKELEKEIQQENVDKIKGKAKELIKQIKMTKILLSKQEQQLKDLLGGKREFTEEELLFDEE
jgi:hypothetical protein